MPEPPRVLLVAGEVAGGIAAHVRSLALELQGLDVDVTVMAPARSLAAMRLPERSVATAAAPVGSLSPRSWWTLRRWLRSPGGEGMVVHAHGLRASALPGVPQGVPLVTTWHNAPLGQGPRLWLHELLERWVAHRASIVLAASDDLADRARRAGARDVRPVLIGSPAPASRSPAGDRARIRESLELAPEASVVLAVGRLHRQKRFDVLVAAAAGWRTDGARQVLIAGDGPMRDLLAGRIAESRAPVRLLGARDDVAALMSAADVVVISSEWEARALVAQEALRAGVALVCTDVGGLPGLVGDAALLVPPGDPVALRDAIDEVIDDPALRARLASRGRERAADWPTAAKFATDMRDLYVNLMSRSGGSAH